MSTQPLFGVLTTADTHLSTFCRNAAKKKAASFVSRADRHASTLLQSCPTRPYWLARAPYLGLGLQRQACVCVGAHGHACDLGWQAGTFGRGREGAGEKRRSERY